MATGWGVYVAVVASIGSSAASGIQLFARPVTLLVVVSQLELRAPRRILTRARGNSILAVAVGLVVGGCGGGAKSPMLHSTSGASAAVPTGQPGVTLADCVSTWNADTSLNAKTIAQESAARGDTQARLFAFSGGECGLTIAGIGPLATFADIGRTGHFDAWLNTSNGNPSPSILPFVESLASQAASDPNVTIATDGSVSPLPGAQITRFTQPVTIPGNGLPGSTGSANAAPYDINAAAWNRLSLKEQIHLVAVYAADRNCPLLAAQQIALAMKRGPLTIKNNSVAATLAAACADPASLATSGTGAAGSTDATPTDTTTGGPATSSTAPAPLITPGTSPCAVFMYESATVTIVDTTVDCSTTSGLVTTYLTKRGTAHNLPPLSERGWTCRAGGLVYCERGQDSLEAQVQ